jgi:hypothetical protein
VPALPGPAAVIKYVPLEAEVLQPLQVAGFRGMHYEKLGDMPCFVMGGVEMREMRLSGWKPTEPARENPCFVTYTGPFKQVTNDEGRVYRCGERVRVDSATWSTLQMSPFARHFVCAR